jgi:cathepsin L
MAIMASDVLARADTRAAVDMYRLDFDLRTDGVPVRLLAPGQLQRELELQIGDGPRYPFKKFSDAYVKKALAATVDWRDQGIVTPAKDQGPHGYCGTFARVAVAEAQFARYSGATKRNFSVEQMIDCVGWDRDQGSVINDGKTGFMPSELYPYNESCATKASCDMDPPVPSNPCRYNAKDMIPKSDGFTNATAAPSKFGEDQFAAFVHHNGPAQAGIYAQMFGRRDNTTCGGVGGGCWVTKESCALDDGKNIDHSVTVIGYGMDTDIDPKTTKAYGPYWLIKNSWSTKFGDNGFIKIARGVNCGNLLESDFGVFTYGDPAKYYEQ